MRRYIMRYIDIIRYIPLLDTHHYQNTKLKLTLCFDKAYQKYYNFNQLIIITSSINTLEQHAKSIPMAIDGALLFSNPGYVGRSLKQPETHCKRNLSSHLTKLKVILVNLKQSLLLFASSLIQMKLISLNLYSFEKFEINIKLPTPMKRFSCES